ncbi:MAG TPA: hypothetical protein VI454_04305 [Verrucomicrobiae bacterium]
MNEREFQRLIETARARALTAEEQTRLDAWLLAHPEAQFEWDEEQHVSRLIGALPDVPMSPNFTARVVAAVEHGQRAQPPVFSFAAWWRRALPMPRLAMAIVTVAVIGVSLWQYHVHERQNVAASVQALSAVAAVPSVDVLKDFDAIRRLGQLPASGDDEVLAALQ